MEPFQILVPIFNVPNATTSSPLLSSKITICFPKKWGGLKSCNWSWHFSNSAVLFLLHVYLFNKVAFRFANQCPIVKCDFKPIGIDRCKEVFRFSWTDWRQIFDKLRFFLVIFIAAFLMQCQHHQLPILETQKIATFTFSLYFPHIFSFLRHRLFYMCACVKNSLWCCAPSYLDYLHLAFPAVLSLPLSGSNFSTDYTFFAASFIISQLQSNSSPYG